MDVLVTHVILPALVISLIVKISVDLIDGW